MNDVSYAEIANKLNDLGIPPKSAKRWSPGTIHKIYRRLLGENYSPKMNRSISDNELADNTQSVIDHYGFATVSRIHELYLEDMALNKIAVQLDLEGFKTPLGKKWHRGQVDYILKRSPKFSMVYLTAVQ